jgi:hypothetical protein
VAPRATQHARRISNKKEATSIRLGYFRSSGMTSYQDFKGFYINGHGRPDFLLFWVVLIPGSEYPVHKFIEALSNRGPRVDL